MSASLIGADSGPRGFHELSGGKWCSSSNAETAGREKPAGPHRETLSPARPSSEREGWRGTPDRRSGPPAARASVDLLIRAARDSSRNLRIAQARARK